MKSLPPQQLVTSVCLLTLSFVLLALLPAYSEEEIQWEYSYIPEQLPQDSMPRWYVRREGSPEILLDDAKLKAELPPGSVLYYAQGTHSGQSPFGDGMWDASGGNTTVEFRLRCKAEDPDERIFVVRVADGTYRWDVHFEKERIWAEALSGGGVALSTTEDDIYRLAIYGKTMQLSSARHGIIIPQIEGRHFDGDRNRVIFGTDSRGESRQLQSTVGWELGYFRWTNQETELNPPEMPIKE
jgi:hypothetical protein